MKTALWIITLVTLTFVPSHESLAQNRESAKVSLSSDTETVITTTFKPATFEKFLIDVYCKGLQILCDLDRPHTASPLGSKEESWCKDSKEGQWRRNNPDCVESTRMRLDFAKPVMRLIILTDIAASDSQWRRDRQIKDEINDALIKGYNNAWQEAETAWSLFNQCQNGQRLDQREAAMRYQAQLREMELLRQKLDIMQRKQDLDANFLATQSILQMMMLNQSPGRR